MMRTARRVTRLVVTLAVAGLLVVAGVTGWRTWHDSGNPFAAGDECRAQVGGHAVSLDPEQARWAGLIVAISVSRGLPARAASIGLATAYQESGLYNLPDGDRDSIGLFQQRPSQGWGTAAELRDPVYATNAFYDALTRVDGYESLPITVAAQQVQRSGFPQAYADHERDARTVASALTGYSAHAFTCRLTDSKRSGSLRTVDRDLGARFPGLLDTAGSSDAATLAVPVADRTRGWAVAQYLVSQAHRLRVASVTYDDRTWRADRPDAGWQAVDTASAAALEVTVTA